MNQSVALKGTEDGYQLVIQSAVLNQKIIEDTSALLEKFVANSKEEAEQDEKETTSPSVDEQAATINADIPSHSFGEKHYQKQGKIQLSVRTENFLLRPEEKQRLKEVIEANGLFEVKSIDANTLLKHTAREWIETHALQVHTGNVRNGQIIEAPTDLLFIGNVQPGGEIRAKRHIFIIGDLKGIAHAGFSGDEKAVIVADFKHQVQIRIAEHVQVIEPTVDLAGNFKAALINDKASFEFQDIKLLDHLRPDITTLMGGELN